MSDPADTASSPSGLQVETTEESPVRHRVEVAVDDRRVKRAFDRAYRDLAQRVQVRGFRPGKAPRSVLEKLYGGSLEEQIEHSLIAETLGDALKQAGLEPVAEPAIESSAPRVGEGFRYTARIEVKPVIELPDLDGLPATRPGIQVGVAEVESELESLRQRHAAVVEEPEGTPLEQGHVASIDFVGRVDGKPFEGGRGQGVEIEIGAGRFVPGFEDQLEGAVSGEDREVTVTFPEDYGNAELAGKEAVFAVHVAVVKRRQVPELDDEFAKDVGDFEGLDDLRARIRSDLTEAEERSARSELHRTLMDSLIERASFEVPPGMVERQLEQQLQSAHQRLEGQVPHEALHDQLERWKEEWRAGAERQVRERLLLEAVARAQGLQVLPEDIEARIAEMAAQQGVAPAQLRKAYGGDAFERVLESQLADEKALEFLAAQAKVEETTDT